MSAPTPNDKSSSPPTANNDSNSNTNYYIKHTTTNAAPANPYIDTTINSINTAPVELDSTPVSPVTRKQSWKAPTTVGGASTVSPDEEEETYAELSGEVGGNGVGREKRKKLLAARSKDPAVLVDLPQTPRAEEYEVATVRKVVDAVEHRGVETKDENEKKS
ncbi:hypothetical protein EJ08DRAFT_711805 [Tothia fuscella]|uniref:Uncharacterized protein n=1 Tax=Tothia fuscella TaxID=1048955 RepID=A0A9P4U3B7_9PEZI|nr:hypothetical protein EJ08DRAFT_711805 [Tothia fuscella]